MLFSQHKVKLTHIALEKICKVQNARILRIFDLTPKKLLKNCTNTKTFYRL